METAIAKIEHQESVIATLIAYITKAAQVQGISKTATEIANMAVTLYEYIKSDDYYSNLTGPEIAEIFRLGAIGKLCDSYGCTVATFCKWMDAYYDRAVENRRRAEIAERIKLQQNMPKQLSRETPEQALQSAITKAYQSYKRGEEVFDFGGCLKREIEKREGCKIESVEEYFRTCRNAPNFNDNTNK